MELPCRAHGDELLKPGELADIRRRLQSTARSGDLTTVIACAFDHRTRILPFLFADTRMVPAGVRAIGSALVDAGFGKTRIVLQQWNRNFRPSRMRLDGRIPDLFLVSSMQIHSAQCQALIRDACRIDPAHRPLIIAGGPKVIYQPWDVFGTDPADPWAADVAVTGEEYVLLSLLEVLLSLRRNSETMRSAFIRARDSGALDEIPGLVYARGGSDQPAEELVDTGIQRLVGDLDELPHPLLGYQLLEPPSRGTTLGSTAIPPRRVHKHSPVASLVLTLGCKFSCPYCPIPAYNQRQYRAKSGERVSDEIEQLYRRYHIRFFFGADDNFFNDRQRTLDIVETLARKVEEGSRPHAKIYWGTEATVHDTLRLKDLLPTARKAGLQALWFGVEDMTGALVRKGQSADKTVEAFRLLRESGIMPVPMMMHHDSQPLFTLGGHRGLLNQVGLLRKAGAVSMHVLMLTPAVGSRSYVDAYTSGQVYQSAGGADVEQYIVDGNYVVASRNPNPWRKQLNLLAAYLYFYNPMRFFIALLRSKTNILMTGSTGTPPGGASQGGSHRRRKLRRRILHRIGRHLGDASFQIFGMFGLLVTSRRTLPWALRLMRGRIKRTTKAPASQIPMRSAGGGPASHALPDAPTLQSESLGPKEKAPAA